MLFCCFAVAVAALLWLFCFVDVFSTLLLPFEAFLLLLLLLLFSIASTALLFAFAAL